MLGAWELTRAYLSLGSNLGNRIENINQAIERISAIHGVRLVNVSAYYETSPVGYLDQPDFVNCAVGIEADISPGQLLKSTMEIENEMGRMRSIRWGPRVIDIDILLYGEIKICHDNLVIPHPRMTERGFVMVPLAEIAPDIQILGGPSVKEIALSLSDDHSIRKLDDPFSGDREVADVCIHS